MEFSKALDIVRNSDLFDEPTDAYVVHGFCTFEGGEWSPWHVGFYRNAADEVSSYQASEPVLAAGASEAFKKEGKILPLIVKDISVSREDALSLALDSLTQNHPQHPASKTIMLLQQLPEGQVYNITVVTSTLHMYTVRIESSTANIVSAELNSLMSLRAE